MLATFPSFQSRFDAIERMQRIMEGCVLGPTSCEPCPTLMLISAIEHAVFAGAGAHDASTQ